jgi:hypothetical protein
MAELLLDNAVDVYCHGIAKIETLGPCRRIVFTMPDAANPGYQNVVIKLIMTAELLATLSYLAAGADCGLAPVARA